MNKRKKVAKKKQRAKRRRVKKSENKRIDKDLVESDNPMWDPSRQPTEDEVKARHEREVRLRKDEVSGYKA